MNIFLSYLFLFSNCVLKGLILPGCSILNIIIIGLLDNWNMSNIELIKTIFFSWKCIQCDGFHNIRLLYSLLLSVLHFIFETYLLQWDCIIWCIFIDIRYCYGIYVFEVYNSICITVDKTWWSATSCCNTEGYCRWIWSAFFVMWYGASLPFNMMYYPSMYAVRNHHDCYTEDCTPNAYLSCYYPFKLRYFGSGICFCPSIDKSNAKEQQASYKS